MPGFYFIHFFFQVAGTPLSRSLIARKVGKVWLKCNKRHWCSCSQKSSTQVRPVGKTSTSYLELSHEQKGSSTAGGSELEHLSSPERPHVDSGPFLSVEAIRGAAEVLPNPYPPRDISRKIYIRYPEILSEVVMFPQKYWEKSKRKRTLRHCFRETSDSVFGLQTKDNCYKGRKGKFALSWLG